MVSLIHQENHCYLLGISKCFFSSLIFWQRLCVIIISLVLMLFQVLSLINLLKTSSTALRRQSHGHSTLFSHKTQMWKALEKNSADFSLEVAKAEAYLDSIHIVLGSWNFSESREEEFFFSFNCDGGFRPFWRRAHDGHPEWKALQGLTSNSSCVESNSFPKLSEATGALSKDAGSAFRQRGPSPSHTFLVALPTSLSEAPWSLARPRAFDKTSSSETELPYWSCT